MKKILCVALALVLIFSLSACGANSAKSSNSPDTKNSPNSPSANQSANNNTNNSNSSNAPSSNATITNTPSEAYGKYTDMKGIAYNNISGKMSENVELVFSAVLTILPVAMVDLTLIPLTIIGVEGGEAALTFLGMGNINIEQSGDVHTITYTSSDGASMTQTCEYDAATDSLKSIISDIGESLDSLVFEYTRCGDGYVSQYAMYEEERGDYTLIKMYFNADGDVTIGIENISGKPDSIFKKTGFSSDFAHNKSSYFALEGGTLTVFSDGKTKTY